MGVIRLIFKTIFESILITSVIVVILALLPTLTVFPSFPLEPQAYQVPNLTKPFDTVPWSNVLEEKGEHLLSNEISGPESLVIKDEFLYTGLADGTIIEVNTLTGKTRIVTDSWKEGPEVCGKNIYWRIRQCGRVLGMRLNSGGILYALDSVFGLHQIDTHTSSKRWIALGPDDKKHYEKDKGIYNDFVFDRKDENIVYVTVSSTKWGIETIPWSIAEHENSGLVLAVDMKTGKIARIAENIYFSNGIEISADNEHLLVASSTGYKILKLSLNEIRNILASGKKATAKLSTFTDKLIGEPDNIRLHDGDLYVGFSIARLNGPSLSDRVSNFPMLRKAVGRILYIASEMLDVFRQLTKFPGLDEAVFKLKAGHIFYAMVPKVGAIGIFDGITGKFKKIMLGKTPFISEAIVDENGDLYYGSFKNRFIGKIQRSRYRQTKSADISI